MLSLILPTYKEAKNLPELLPKIEAALSDIPHEILIVDDDSPDRTWEVALGIAKDIPSVRVVRRIGRYGLSSAVIEGFLASSGDVFAVMDADGQHDLQMLPALYASAHSGADIAIGSRYTDGGSVGDWDERRHLLSRMATRMAIALCRVSVKDPMSGFFAIRRSAFEEIQPLLNPKGFKILLDLLVHAPRSLRAEEIPFTFGIRLHGESKLSRRVQLEFLEYLYDVTLGKYIPLVFVKYCIVGALGVLVNYAAYQLLFSSVGDTRWYGFSVAVLLGIEAAIFFNFLLNNYWTFARVRLRGLRVISGFFTFNVACLFGALGNYAVYALLVDIHWTPAVAVLLGAALGAVWNYTMSRMITWTA